MILLDLFYALLPIATLAAILFAANRICMWIFGKSMVDIYFGEGTDKK